MVVEKKDSATTIWPSGTTRMLKGFSEGLQHGFYVLLHGAGPKPSETKERLTKEQIGQGSRARGAAARKHLPEYRSGGRKTKFLRQGDH